MKQTKKTNKVTKKMSFTEVIQNNPEAIGILFNRGMHCIGCGMATIETLEEGALAHGLDPDELVDEINKSSLEKTSEKTSKNTIDSRKAKNLNTKNKLNKDKKK